MNYFLRSKALLSSVTLFSLTAYAANENTPYYTIEGSETVIIPLNQIRNYSLLATDAESLSGIKTIALRKIRPSEQLLKQDAANRAAIAGNNTELDYSKGIIPFANSQGSVDIGMENVPVLDQGQFGTCVTFSSTAALNARFKLGDYIDQQCSLALDEDLNTNYWDGADTPSQIFTPLIANGFVKKDNCFGVKYANITQKVTPAQYMTISDKTYENQIKTTYATVVTTSLDAIKAALNAKNRVLIGFFLADIKGDVISDDGFNININGVVDRGGGLWACKQPSSTTNYCPPQSQLTEGHEVVVIGYDDKQQLLKIRNSWGPQVGDGGDYYMTYTFFNAMVTDYTVLL